MSDSKIIVRPALQRTAKNRLGIKIVWNGCRYTITEYDYKKYTVQAKVAIKREAFFEALISDYSIPHNMVGLKDIGIDYICMSSQ